MELLKLHFEGKLEFMGKIADNKANMEQYFFMKSVCYCDVNREIELIM